MASALVLLAATVIAYLLGPEDPWSRAVVANTCWTLTALFAVGCCVRAARRTTGDESRAWRWVAAGCAAYLLGQLVWSYYELGLRVEPPYPSLADVGYLALYPCLAIGLSYTPPTSRARRRTEATAVLDAVLVSFTAAGLTHQLLLQPILEQGGPWLPVATSIARACGGVLILWMLLLQMARRRGFAVGSAGLVTAGVAVLCITNLVYGRRALGGAFIPGRVLDLGWDAALLLIGAAAALAPEGDARVPAAARGPSGDTAHTIAVLVAVLGIALLASLDGFRTGSTADVWVALGIALIGVRVIYTLRADRQYAEVLEHEVADQTRHLVDSLAATAAAERNVRLVMEAVPDAIFVLDPDGRPRDLNSAARTLLAAAPLESGAVGALYDILDPSAHEIARDHLVLALGGAVRSFEAPLRRAAGVRRTGAVSFAPVRDGRGVSNVLALVRDVTDQKRTASQLQQAEKLAAIGQLVSGVAHEINNPAAIISGFAQTLLLDVQNPEQREMAQMIYDEASRIGRITQNLLAFARAGGRERTLIDLNDILRRTFALRSYHLSTLNITVTLDLDPSDPKVWANASDIQQMLLNLVINAEQALLTVEPPRTITIRSRPSDTEVRLEIADNGPGVPADIRGRIFDPFFTTKPEGVGTGLGLSICYGVVREHGGRISVESEPEQGAKFIVELPRDPRGEARPPSETRLPAGPPVRGLRVLLVEDEASLRNAVLQFLARRAIDVMGVSDGVEALEALAHGSFDVIVSDVRMPGMSGREFMERLRQTHPELVSRLIFSTGDAFTGDTAALLDQAGRPILTKPFDFASLERLIREVAGRSKTAQSYDMPGSKT